MSAVERGASRLGLGAAKGRNAHGYGAVSREKRARQTAARTAARESRLPLVRARVNRSRTARTSSGKLTAFGLISRLFTLMIVCVGLVAISVGLLAGYRWMTTLNYFSIKDVQVAGLNRMSREDLLAQAEVSPGMNLLAVNMESVESQLTRNPWIESASVTRVLPDTLKIRVVERDPSYLVQYEDKLCYADGEGRIIDTVRPGKFVSLPQVEVEAGMERHLGLLEALRKDLAQGKAPFGMDQVAWIRLSWRYGLEIRLLDRNVLLCVGVDNWKQNMTHINLVWANLAKRGELDQAAIISSQNKKVWVEKRV